MQMLLINEAEIKVILKTIVFIYGLLGAITVRTSVIMQI